MTALPLTTTPEALAERMGWSPRRLRKLARELGACRIQWAGAIRRAGIAALSYHCCRHGFATGLLEQGISPITVAKRGGWKDARHVFETYGHDIADRNVTDVLTGAPVTHTGGKRNAIK